MSKKVKILISVIVCIAVIAVSAPVISFFAGTYSVKGVTEYCNENSRRENAEYEHFVMTDEGTGKNSYSIWLPKAGAGDKRQFPEIVITENVDCFGGLVKREKMIENPFNEYPEEKFAEMKNKVGFTLTRHKDVNGNETGLFNCYFYCDNVDSEFVDKCVYVLSTNGHEVEKTVNAFTSNGRMFMQFSGIGKFGNIDTQLTSVKFYKGDKLVDEFTPNIV